MYRYKKALLLMIFLSLCALVSAENIQETTTKNISEPTVVTQTISDEIADNDLFQILMFSCDDWIDENKIKNKFMISVRPWQQKDMCLLVYNKLEKKVDINLSFYEWKKDKDMVSCWDVSHEGDKFMPLIENISWWIFSLSLSSGQQIVTTFKMKLPKNSSTGVIYWCIWATIDWSISQKPWDMLGIIVRKYIPATITVTWPVYNLWWRDDIKDTNNKALFLKIIIGILALLLILSVINPQNKKEKYHKKQ